MPASPLKTAAIVIYGTLIISMVMVPQATRNWIRNFDPGPAQAVLLSAAEVFLHASETVGTNVLYQRGRAEFFRLTGKSETD